VRLHPTLAKIAHRPKSVSGAGHVDLARHALAYPPLLPLRGNSGDIRYLTDKFVSQRAAKPMVAAQYLRVRIAYPGKPHANERPTRPHLGRWLANLGQLLVSHHKADHLHFTVRICPES